MVSLGSLMVDKGLIYSVDDPLHLVAYERINDLRLYLFITKFTQMKHTRLYILHKYYT